VPRCAIRSAAISSRQENAALLLVGDQPSRTAGIFAFGAVIAGALLRRGPLRSVSTPTAADDLVTTAQAEASRERAP
jgi:hypothetical protein